MKTAIASLRSEVDPSPRLLKHSHFQRTFKIAFLNETNLYACSNSAMSYLFVLWLALLSLRFNELQLTSPNEAKLMPCPVNPV